MSKRPEQERTLYIAGLEQAVQAYLDYLESDDYNEDGEDDYRNDVFEAGIQVFYEDPEIWQYINGLHDRL